MIKIIRGVYGARINGRVTAVTKDSAPIKLTKAEEERLVNQGFAKYVEENQEPQKPKEVADLEKMNFNELKAKAAEMGLTVQGNSKKDYIAAIKDAENQEPQEPQGNQEPAAPTFDAGNTVV